MALKLTAGETLLLEVGADRAAVVTFHIAGPAKRTITATHDGAGTFSISESTSGWLPGFYRIEAREVVAGITTVIARYSLNVEAALSDIPVGADLRSTAAKAVANIEAMLSGSSTLEARRYKINNRELERYSVGELLTLLSFWKRKLASEERKASGINSLGPRIEVRI